MIRKQDDEEDERINHDLADHDHVINDLADHVEKIMI